MTWISSSDKVSVRHDVQLLRQWHAGLPPIRVGLVYGAVSAEDRLYISEGPAEQLSINAMLGALADLGLRPAVLDPCSSSFVRSLVGFDVIVPSMHGPFGEDGRLQGLLDYMRLPYCGSGVSPSALAADKALCKLVMEAVGVPTPRWAPAGRAGVALASGCRRGVMVKPRMGGSSVGMELVRDMAGVDDAVARAESIDPAGAIVEEFKPGVAVTVGLLELPSGVLVMPPLATEPLGSDFYDARAKLDPDGERLVSYGQARLPAPTTEKIHQCCFSLWHGLGCQGMARIDFVVGPDGPFALEVNTIPGMSSESNFVAGAALAGLTYSDVTLAMLRHALTREQPDVPLPVVSVNDLVREPAVMPHGGSREGDS